MCVRKRERETRNVFQVAFEGWVLGAQRQKVLAKVTSDCLCRPLVFFVDGCSVSDVMDGWTLKQRGKMGSTTQRNPARKKRGENGLPNEMQVTHPPHMAIVLFIRLFIQVNASSDAGCVV